MIRKLFIKKTLLAGAFAVAAMLCAPHSLRAQHDYQGSPDARQHGFEHGYRAGFAFGQNYQVSNRDQDIVNQQLRAADKDYQPAFGSQDEYRQGYSEGFRSGMDDSRAGNRSRLEDLFRARDPNYDPDRNRDPRIQGIDPQNHWPPRHVADDVGYRDGFDTGIRDRRDGRSPQPRQHSAWRNGMHGYDGSGASKGQFKFAYRAAYEVGYRDGFGNSRAERPNDR